MTLIINQTEFEKLHPKQLKKMLDESRASINKCKFLGIDPVENEILFSKIKKQLDNFPHIPNKKEAKLLRQNKAKSKK